MAVVTGERKDRADSEDNKKPPARKRKSRINSDSDPDYSDSDQ